MCRLGKKDTYRRMDEVGEAKIQSTSNNNAMNPSHERKQNTDAGVEDSDSKFAGVEDSDSNAMNPSHERKQNTDAGVEDSDSKFVWDAGTGLYFHASSGFYHNPNAGWYYSSTDGLYYKFENGGYVPLEDCQGFNNITSSIVGTEDCAANNSVNCTEQPFRGYSNNSIGRGSENASVSEEESSYSLWYYDNNLSEYWYFDENSNSYYQYVPAIGFGMVEKETHGMEDILMTPNSSCLNNSEYKDIGKSDLPCNDTSKKQSAVEGWPYDASMLKVEPTGFTAESAEKESIEDEEAEGNDSNLREGLLAEGGDPQRPSEWIEETLINLYLKGYSNLENEEEEPRGSSTCDDADLARQKRDEEIEEGEWVPEDALGQSPSSQRKENKEYGSLSDENRNIMDEENWRAQYGQVVRSTEEDSSPFSALDLWDWTMVIENMKGKKGEIARLVGRLASKCKTLHPSIKGGGSLLKTGAIHEVHLDLVRVSSGQIYRLRCPSARYVASLRTFDSSNPTQDWGFPLLKLTNSEKTLEDFVDDSDPANASNYCDSTLSKPFVPNLMHQHSLKRKRQEDTWRCARVRAYTNKEQTDAELRKQRYKDRAAERRILHGGIGTGPGQKNTDKNEGDVELCSTTEIVESSGGEIPHHAFGAGSFARRLLEGMGWKEGESLGNKKDGLISPLQAVGNKGHFGLGWT